MTVPRSLSYAEARERVLGAVRPGAVERVSLAAARGRALRETLTAPHPLPPFDNSSMDGWAARSADLAGATGAAPVTLAVVEILSAGRVPSGPLGPGEAMRIMTGAMMPQGADAVIPLEDAEGLEAPARVRVAGPVARGDCVRPAAADLAAGATVLAAGHELSPHDLALLAALGFAEVPVGARPSVAILSTGDEIIAPGQPMRPGLVYDSNAQILADAVRELGAEPISHGIVPDDLDQLRAWLHEALRTADVVLLSGGTSKGAGDLSYRVVGELSEPGIVAHGVALKPGKPICLASHRGKPVVILPGFPTSAIFTFHEFVAPVIRRMSGVGAGPSETVRARLALQTTSERGRLEYLLVGLVQRDDGQLAAYPMGKGSGSVTAWSRADGFVRVPRNTEILEAETRVEVTLIGSGHAVADLVVVGSHCAGLDRIASALAREGFVVKVQAVGSQGGLAAAERGECDAAPMHLLDPATDRYNEPFLGPELRLLRGYLRMQGVATRADETRDIAALLTDASLRMVNRNRGSGTRVLIDELLASAAGPDGSPLRPAGFAYEPRSHYAVAAAIAQKRADWGVTIEPIARAKGLRFRPLRAEHYDFAIPASRWDRPAVQALRRLLAAGTPLRAELEAMGFGPPEEIS